MLEREVLEEAQTGDRRYIFRLERELKRVKTRWNGLSKATIYIQDGEGLLRRWYPTPLEELEEAEGKVRNNLSAYDAGVAAGRAEAEEELKRRAKEAE